MLKLLNKLIFFKFKSDTLENLYYCINSNVSLIYNLKGLDRDYRYIKDFDLLKEQIEIVNYDLAFSCLEAEFYTSYDFYMKKYKKESEELKKRRLYRILDKTDIEFMNTDLYKKYPKIFNLMLGVKSFEYKDKDNNFYFARISPLKSIPDCEFVKLSEDDVFTRAIRTDCNFEHNISSFALDILLSEEEKNFYINFFKVSYEKGRFAVGQFYRYIEEEDIKERNTIDYKKNSKLYEDILGIFVISYIGDKSLLLSKLDYYQYESAYDFRYELSFDEFNCMNFELLNQNYEEYVDGLLQNMYMRSRDFRIARKWKL